jgi:hemerythrin
MEKSTNFSILTQKEVSMEKTMLEHNVFIVWSSEYNLGIPIIDEQHRGIVSTINSLHFGLQNNFGKHMLSPIIDMMHNYTRIHFQVEESFLEKIDFPHAKKHHELHNDLTTELFNAGKNSVLDKDPYEFMDFLKNWWINHICREDLIYRDYILPSAKK